MKKALTLEELTDKYITEMCGNYNEKEIVQARTAIYVGFHFAMKRSQNKRWYDVPLRVVTFPFILSLIVIKYLFHAVLNACYFLRYGGEWITYAKDNRATTNELFHELKSKKYTELVYENTSSVH